MKVLFIVRSTLYTVRGGDTIQVVETAEHLQQLGIQVSIKKTNEKINYNDFDLLHFFNITRPADILVHIKKTGKPFVLSPILINYAQYDQQYRTGFAGKLFRVLSPAQIEYCKTVYRAIKGNDSLVSFSYLFKGQRRSIKEVLEKAVALLVNASEEYEEIIKEYKVTPKKYIVPNGINEKLFVNTGTEKRKTDLIICVARIEGIKNQYNLIKALNNTKYQLLIIGDPAPNQRSYYDNCKKIAASNISFISYLSQQELLRYYGIAKVHVLPSWFEVCGLSSLEAAVMGCNIVITNNGYASSYFGDKAYYCDPAVPASIYKAIDMAAQNITSLDLQQKIKNSFTWQQAAEKISIAYKNTLACCY